jgi:hypothetical protein
MKKNKAKKLPRKSVSEKDAKAVKGGVGIKIGMKK